MGKVYSSLTRLSGVGSEGMELIRHLFCTVGNPPLSKWVLIMQTHSQNMESAEKHQVKEELLAKWVNVNSKSIISLDATVFLLLKNKYRSSVFQTTFQNHQDKKVIFVLITVNQVFKNSLIALSVCHFDFLPVF